MGEAAVARASVSNGGGLGAVSLGGPGGARREDATTDVETQFATKVRSPRRASHIIVLSISRGLLHHRQTAIYTASCLLTFVTSEGY